MLGQQFDDRRGTRGIGRHPVELRQRDHELLPVSGEAATGWARAEQLGTTTVHFGLRRVTEPQLDPGADVVFQHGAQLSPPTGREHHVDADRQPLRHHCGDGVLERIEVAAQHCPAVHRQHDLTVVIRKRHPRSVLLPKVLATAAQGEQLRRDAPQ